MKRIMIVTAILAILTLAGCAENRELDNNGIITGANDGGISDSSIVSSNAEEHTNSASEVEDETSVNTSEPVESIVSSVESKPEEKPVESTSSKVEEPVVSTSTAVEKPVASTTTSKPVAPVASTSTTTSKPSTPVSSSTTISKPVSSSTSTTSSNPSTSVSTSKPVEKPTHNCSTDGHVWEVTTTTTEPKWCREMHNVTDFGFDLDLASKHFGIDAGEAYKTFKNTCKENGVSGISGRATIDVEVWGTETYETKVCTICGHGEGGRYIATINPIGEWRYINGQNPRCSVNDRYNFNTLFYDPYNVPQVVIDNIRIYKGL